MQPGDTIDTPPGEWHWHGAAPTHFIIHLAMWEAPDPDSGQPETVWGEHVTDAELFEVFDDFAFDEVLQHGDLDTRPRLMVHGGSSTLVCPSADHRLGPQHYIFVCRAIAKL